MRGRESGMPPRQQWETFFEPDEILQGLSDPGHRKRCLEFGCGYGTFTIALARFADVKQVVSLDIDDEMIAMTERRLADAELRNVRLERRDFLSQGCGLPDGWSDWAMIFNLLHIEQSSQLLQEAFRVLRPGGTLAIIHWRDDIETPRGPSMSIRPSRDDCRSWAESLGFECTRNATFKNNPWHWGLKMRRRIEFVPLAKQL